MTAQLGPSASPVGLCDKELDPLEQTLPVHSRKMLEHHCLDRTHLIMLRHQHLTLRPPCSLIAQFLSAVQHEQSHLYEHLRLIAQVQLQALFQLFLNLISHLRAQILISLNALAQHLLLKSMIQSGLVLHRRYQLFLERLSQLGLYSLFVKWILT